MTYFMPRETASTADKAYADYKAPSAKKVKSVAGKVCIDYKDPLTGKVKERVEGNNHTFNEMFMADGWWDILNALNVANFFVMDDDAPPDDSFPYLRGNIIGWGQNNQQASGNYQGDYIASESYRNKLIPEENKMRFFYSYMFGAHQLQGNIGSFGFTNQFQNFQTQLLPLFPVRNFNTSIPDAYWCVKGTTGCAVLETPTVTICDFATGETRTVDLSFMSGISTGYISIGVNAEDNRMYVLVGNNTAANIRLYEYADNTFTVLLRTFTPSVLTGANSPGMHGDGASSACFAVYGDEMFYHTSPGNTSHASVANRTKYMKMNFIENTEPIQLDISPCPYNTSLATSGSTNGNFFTKPASSGSRFSVYVRDNKIFWTYQIGSVLSQTSSPYATSGRLPVWDMKNDKLVTTLTSHHRSGDRIRASWMMDNPASPNKAPLHYWYNDVNYHFPSMSKWFHRAALACYAVPKDMPPRPENSAVNIRYQIDVGL